MDIGKGVLAIDIYNFIRAGKGVLAIDIYNFIRA